jgi:hypothetical protein
VLAELKALQRDLDRAIAAFEAIVTGPLPDETVFAPIRLRLTRVSARKQMFLQTHIYPMLAGLSEVEKFEVQRFRREGAAQLQRAAEHVTVWTMERIVRDWGGFQGMSALVRAAMWQNQNEESRILYPLIARMERPKAA